GTVCVVGKIRDLILQLSKSSIYSTKPKQTINMHKTMGWFGIFMAFFSLHLSRQEATLNVTSIQGPRVN
ncbi:hypothetical protein ACPXBH_23220, partial [Enterobacter hormaechei]